jgi:hypothetical protein
MSSFFKCAKLSGPVDKVIPNSTMVKLNQGGDEQ